MIEFQLRNQGKGVCLDRMGVPYGNEIGASGCHGFSSNQVTLTQSQKLLCYGISTSFLKYNF